MGENLRKLYFRATANLRAIGKSGPEQDRVLHNEYAERTYCFNLRDLYDALPNARIRQQHFFLG